jgi:Caspase domain
MRTGTVPQLKGSSDHAALAARRPHQLAYEAIYEDEFHGAFSTALLSDLGRPAAASTYRELLTGARHRVENWLGEQVPGLYPVTEPLADQPFLGGQATWMLSWRRPRQVSGGPPSSLS